MDDWFTVEKIDSKTYVISEYQHWEEVHSYLLLGDTKALLIDCGLGIANIQSKINELTDLPVVVALTHVHWDHIGGLKYYNDIAVHPLEEDWLERFPIPLSVVKKNVLRQPHGEFPSNFNIDSYEIYQGKPSILLNDNDVIDIGNRWVKAIHTPGHSPGHMVYYDMDNRYLFTGDLVYYGKLDAFYPSCDPILFKKSIEKILQLKVDKVLPGHHHLNVRTELINDIYDAFCNIEQKGELKQGMGIYEYQDFSIHI